MLNVVSFLLACQMQLSTFDLFFTLLIDILYSPNSFVYLYYLLSYFAVCISGATFERLWVGQSYPDTNIIPLAILFRDTSVCIYRHSDFLLFF